MDRMRRNDDKRQPGPVETAVAEAIRHARRVIVAVVGGTVLLLGLVMVFTPGPALVLIPTGLAILAIEFAWARRLLRRVRDEIAQRSSRGNREDTERTSKDT